MNFVHCAMPTNFLWPTIFTNFLRSLRVKVQLLLELISIKTANFCSISWTKEKKYIHILVYLIPSTYLCTSMWQSHLLVWEIFYSHFETIYFTKSKVVGDFPTSFLTISILENLSYFIMNWNLFENIGWLCLWKRRW